MKKSISIITSVFLFLCQAHGQLSLSGLPQIQPQIKEYSAYNFSHLDPGYSEMQISLASHGSMKEDQLNNLVLSEADKSEFQQSFTRYKSGGGGQKVKAGPLMAAVGIVGMIAGLVGMSQVGGVDENNTLTPPKLSHNDWKTYNTYSNVAVAGAALFTVGLVVCIAEGDMNHSNTRMERGPSFYGSSGPWWFGFFGHSHHHYGGHHHGGGGHYRGGGGHFHSGGGHRGGGGHHGGGHSFHLKLGKH